MNAQFDQICCCIRYRFDSDIYLRFCIFCTKIFWSRAGKKYHNKAAKTATIFRALINCFKQKEKSQPVHKLQFWFVIIVHYCALQRLKIQFQISKSHISLKSTPYLSSGLFKKQYNAMNPHLNLWKLPPNEKFPELYQ